MCGEGCQYWKVVSFNFLLKPNLAALLGALSLFLLCLTSLSAQRFLSHEYLQQLGHISFSAYLISPLCIDFLMTNTSLFLASTLGHGIAWIISFILFTPVVVVLAWILWKFVD